MTTTVLNERFGIEGVLAFRDVGNGFIVADISNSAATASVALQGAHLMTWQPTGQQPVIWMSPVAKLAPSKSIRGGVPVCWPWFGAHSSNSNFPGHGFARTVAWDVIASGVTDEGATKISFRIATTKAEQWPHDAPAEMQMVIGKTLQIHLVTHNKGDKAITMGDALHTYFAVGDASKLAIRGLDDCDYLDKVDGGCRKQQSGDVTIASEVDRVYFDQGQDVVIDDPALARAIRISKQNSHSTIVWNPWIDKCRSMGDFGSDDGYLGMVCVESANAADDVVQLQAGETHSLSVCYSVETL
jgi:D-hexose-6-phosphate mutarotase